MQQDIDPYDQTLEGVRRHLDHGVGEIAAEELERMTEQLDAEKEKIEGSEMKIVI